MLLSHDDSARNPMKTSYRFNYHYLIIIKKTLKNNPKFTIKKPLNHLMSTIIKLQNNEKLTQ